MPVSKSKLPCTCGSFMLEMWNGDGMYTIKCSKCGKEAYGRTKFDVIENWNNKIRSERDGEAKAGS